MTPDNNHFGLPDPTELYCSVWRFRIHHATLLVRVHDGGPETVGWLSFSSPHYFDGPMTWKSAAFRLGSPEEMLALLPYIGREKMDVDRFLRREHLYLVKAENRIIRIVASNAGLYEGFEKIRDLFA